jgi:hypothetical protein
VEKGDGEELENGKEFWPRKPDFGPFNLGSGWALDGFLIDLIPDSPIPVSPGQGE